MSVDFASAQKDFESWKTSYMRKTPGAKDRLSRMVMIRHSELEDVIQNELVSAGNQRYVYVGKCSAERGFNGIMIDSIPKTNQYQQVKASVSLYQMYIVDLDTVPDYDLGCTEDAVLTRVAGSWSLNTTPQRNRYIYLVLFANNDSLDGANVQAPSRPTTAPTQKAAAPPAGRAAPAPTQQVASNKLANGVQSRPTSSIAAPSRQQALTQTQATSMAAPAKQLTQTQTQANGTDAKRPNTVTIASPPNKPGAPARQLQQQPAVAQQTLKAQNGKPMQTTQANSRPGTAPAQRAPSAPVNPTTTTFKQPNRRY